MSRRRRRLDQQPGVQEGGALHPPTRPSSASAAREARVSPTSAAAQSAKRGSERDGARPEPSGRAICSRASPRPGRRPRRPDLAGAQRSAVAARGGNRRQRRIACTRARTECLFGSATPIGLAARRTHTRAPSRRHLSAAAAVVPQGSISRQQRRKARARRSETARAVSARPEEQEERRGRKREGRESAR